MGLVRSWIRWVAVGRRDGVRARVREQLGVFTWLDKGSDRGADPGPGAAVDAPEPMVERGTASPADRVASAGADVPVAAVVGEPWVRVARADEVRPGEVVEVSGAGRTFALANVDGELLAVDATCPHAGGPLGDGHLEGCVLTCPWHGWSYDLRTGRSSVDDDVSVPTFPTKVVDGSVWLNPDPDPRAGLAEPPVPAAAPTAAVADDSRVPGSQPKGASSSGRDAGKSRSAASRAGN